MLFEVAMNATKRIIQFIPKEIQSANQCERQTTLSGWVGKKRAVTRPSEAFWMPETRSAAVQPATARDRRYLKTNELIYSCFILFWLNIDLPKPTFKVILDHLAISHKVIYLGKGAWLALSLVPTAAFILSTFTGTPNAIWKQNWTV